MTITRSLALAFLICFGGSLSIFAQNPLNAPFDAQYLALGDSLAFGFNPFVDPPDLSKYNGYPNIVSSTLHLNVANASCPGETSSSFITGGAGLSGFVCGAKPEATVIGPNGVPMQFPIRLFVNYQGAKSQLGYAVNYLKHNPNPKLVTINIGGNDLGPAQECILMGHPITTCEMLLPGILAQLAANLETIYSAIRNTGYTGPIVAANYYSFDYSLTSIYTPVFAALNGVILTVTTAFGGKVADVFTAFQIASGPSGNPCQAGLLLKVPNSNTCDTHPSQLGQALMAAVVAFQAEGW